MPRVIGVDIPNNKQLVISLTYIFGVGRTTAEKICKDLNLDPVMKAQDLTEEEVTNLATHIQKTYPVEGQLRRTIAGNISRLRDAYPAFCPTSLEAGLHESFTRTS